MRGRPVHLLGLLSFLVLSACATSGSMPADPETISTELAKRVGADARGWAGRDSHPIALSGDKPGHEIEHPLAVVILGGLVTSTILNLFLLPPLYLRFGRR